MAHQRLVEQHCQRHAQHAAAAHDQQVFGLEVAPDVATGSADRAADADLARALLDPEAGQSADAQGGDEQQARGRREQQSDHAGVVLEVALPQLRETAPSLVRDQPQRTGLGQCAGRCGQHAVAVLRCAAQQILHLAARRKLRRQRDQMIDRCVAQRRAQQVVDHADDGDLAVAIQRFADGRLAWPQLLRQRAGDDQRARGGGGIFVGMEVAAGDQARAHGLHKTGRAGVIRGLDATGRLHRALRARAFQRLPVGTAAIVVGAARQRRAEAERGCRFDTGNAAQRQQVGLLLGLCVAAALQAAHRDQRQFVLGQAARGPQPFDPPTDQEHRVGDEGAGQRHLQHQQRGGEAVVMQAGEDGTDRQIHIRCP